jgi:polysaccharide export outer membrane protein
MRGHWGLGGRPVEDEMRAMNERLPGWVAAIVAGLAGLLLALMVAQAGPAAAQEAGGYRLGPDDAIQVVVYGQPEASIATRVKSDGSIVMPFIGTVQVSGLTNIALARLITERMVSGGYLRQPVVNVEITQYVSRAVNVAGRVTSPGIIPLDRPYRALEALLKAGWIRDNGASYVYLRRPGQAEMRLAAEDLVRGQPEKDPLLQPGDTLFVPDADQFYIYGQINRSGSYPVLPGMTVQQAIAIAGGVTATGSTGKVGLVRGGAREVSADLTQEIRKDDVLIVKERLF